MKSVERFHKVPWAAVLIAIVLLFLGTSKLKTCSVFVQVRREPTERLRAPPVFELEEASSSTEPDFAAPASKLGSFPTSKKPPMGWMAWFVFRCSIDCEADPDNCVSDKLFREMTDALVNKGFLEAGYKTISIDDCWELQTRSKEGLLQADPARFPHGMKALGDYIHSKGAKFGLYVDLGTYTCKKYPGTEYHEAIDAKTLADFGVDYIKADMCYNSGGMDRAYKVFGNELRKQDRDIMYSCSWPAGILDEHQKPFTQMAQDGCTLWRNWKDIQCKWSSLKELIDHYGKYSKYLSQVAFSLPGHYHDLDMLIAGGTIQGKICYTNDEAKLQLAIWSMMGAPLIMGNDLRNLSDFNADILLNKDMIAVNQDSAMPPGYRISQINDMQEIWMRKLSNGKTAVGLVNKDETKATISLSFDKLGFPENDVSMGVKDIFEKKALGVFKNTFETSVNPHGVVFLLLSPQYGEQ